MNVFRLTASEHEGSSYNHYPIEVVSYLMRIVEKMGNEPSLEFPFKDIKFDMSDEGAEWWEKALENTSVFFERYPATMDLLYFNGWLSLEIANYIMTKEDNKGMNWSVEMRHHFSNEQEEHIYIFNPDEYYRKYPYGNYIDVSKGRLRIHIMDRWNKLDDEDIQLISERLINEFPYHSEKLIWRDIDDLPLSKDLSYLFAHTNLSIFGDKYKVTKADCIGQVKDISPIILQFMCEQQVAQRNTFNPEVFQIHFERSGGGGGFSWDRARVGVIGELRTSDKVRRKNCQRTAIREIKLKNIRYASMITDDVRIGILKEFTLEELKLLVKVGHSLFALSQKTSHYIKCLLLKIKNI